MENMIRHVMSLHMSNIVYSHRLGSEGGISTVKTTKTIFRSPKFASGFKFGRQHFPLGSEAPGTIRNLTDERDEVHTYMLDTRPRRLRLVPVTPVHAREPVQPFKLAT